MGITRFRAGELAALLTGAEAPAYTEPGKAAANLPCFLIGPPILAPGMAAGGWTATWRIYALASITAGPAAAWDDLDDLIDKADQVLAVERAEPTTYQLPNGADPLPAYVLTITEGI